MRARRGNRIIHPGSTPHETLSNPPHQSSTRAPASCGSPTRLSADPANMLSRMLESGRRVQIESFEVDSLLHRRFQDR